MRIATKGSKIDISSEKKLEEFAINFSKKIKAGEIYFLFGEIGVGKTTFVKNLINSLQFNLKLKETEVTSPTFNIMNEYNFKSFLIKHYDLYRLKSDTELKDLNLFEKNDKSILFIEWPQIIKNEPHSVNKLYFEYENEYQNRFIKL
jgi:tRNA threonylcarbamoyladenosine biosynthesis protein TsaE|tara:strand:+ start:2827 stop:3267 length:441 start_codon:yes stop_codon:yes gene_type:complete